MALNCILDMLRFSNDFLFFKAQQAFNAFMGVLHGLATFDGVLDLGRSGTTGYQILKSHPAQDRSGWNKFYSFFRVYSRFRRSCVGLQTISGKVPDPIGSGSARYQRNKKKKTGFEAPRTLMLWDRSEIPRGPVGAHTSGNYFKLNSFPILNQI